MKKFAMAVSSAMLALSCAAHAQGDVIARAGDASVTQADMTAFLKALSPDIRTRLAADPAQLDRLVRAKLAASAVLAEAHAKGWDKQPQVTALIDETRRDVILRSYLASVSAPSADYPSDAEIQSAYDRNPALFTQPHAVRLSQIYIAVPAGADAATVDKARKQAADLARQARASGADFATLAKANSQESQSAANGGDMGFVPDGLLMPEIRKAVDGMKPGDVAGPLQTKAGFHVIKLTDTRAQSVRPLADVKEQLRAQLRQQREAQNAQAYMAKLADPSAATIDEDALKKALAAVH
ncbi:peptidylprolyl isomerase [Paraburkholderia humisilvae]|uniref:Putative parvulin-type peptidyl-prolyl cis-trans isomerase n=1 Tax=Paraburkholderia humisilvae TaxID=627669 RepID=A0A6J5DM70_9BURK|nr:peptidylprolyl isomerase [Paraburkholderia humisilvae]CAB3755269.1 putative parvulin-type peptidyl-prolyl cis-trans isomerase [Paraburkholderia humisilvae]